MSATVFGTSKFGAASEESTTGLYVANISFAATSENAVAPNHLGQDQAMAIFNESIDVSLDGVIKTKGSGMVIGIADVVALANFTADSLNIGTDLLKTTPVSNASTIITGGTISRTNNGFETGDLTGVYKPGIDSTAASNPA
jgi:hypothetical protein